MGRSGMFSSVAAAVSLMIASVIAMLVISSMVAFNGWPGVVPARGTTGAVSMAQVRAERSHARQRVVLGGESSRPAARRATRSARRRTAPTGRRQKVTRVRRTLAARPPAPAAGEVLGVSESSKPEPAAAEPVAARDTDPGPVKKVVDDVVMETDELLAAPMLAPVGDVLDALRP